MAGLPEQGRLDDVPLPRLLLELHRQGFGGTLMLSRDRVGKRFLFHEGVPVFAESTLPSESLGVQLMDAGSISRDDYSKVVGYVQRHHCKEGKALLELGLLDAKGLFLALKEQVRLRVVECFGWPHGEFFLDPSTAPSADAQPFRTDLHALLQEALETHWSADRILRDLEPKMRLYPCAGKSFRRIAPRLRGDEAVQALFEALDGARTLWKAVQLAKTPRALAAAWVLDASHALDYRAEPLAPEDGAEGRGEREPAVEILFGASTPQEGRPGRPAAGAHAAAAGLRRDPASEGLMREIAAKHAGLGSLDLYGLLGVPHDADAATLKRVYLKAAKTYHPDALARLEIDAEARAQASRVFAEIGKAWAVLADPRQRADYDAALGVGGIDANALATAETLYRKGEILLRQGNFKVALEFLRPAVEAWPDEGAYQSALGWALYKKLPSEPRPALEHLERAAALEPADGVILFRLGVVLRALGEEARASALLARARLLGAAA
jgi:tetratricopeptide (TPR) repeat protein